MVLEQYRIPRKLVCLTRRFVVKSNKPPETALEWLASEVDMAMRFLGKNPSIAVPIGLALGLGGGGALGFAVLKITG